MHRSVRSRLRLHPAKYIMAGCAACAVLTASRALANDCMGPNLAALPENAFLWEFLVALVIIPVTTCLVEARILSFFLKIGYLRCLGYATVANSVSMAIGLVWLHSSGGEGWKTALVTGQTDVLLVLLVRSFLVTLAEETVVILSIVHESAGVGLVFKAVAAANVVSYAMSAVFMLSCR